MTRTRATSTRFAKAVHHTSLLVLADSFLEEIGFSLERDVLHKLERIFRILYVITVECTQQSISHKLNVLTHHTTVHADETHRKSIGKELLLNDNRFFDD